MKTKFVLKKGTVTPKTHEIVIIELTERFEEDSKKLSGGGTYPTYLNPDGKNLKIVPENIDDHNTIFTVTIEKSPYVFFFRSEQ